MAPSSLPLDTKIEYCESWFEHRGQPSVFRLTELADPGLEHQLDERGYVPFAPTNVMTAGLRGHKVDTGVRLASTPPPGWLEVIPAAAAGGQPAIDRLHSQLTSAGGTSRFAWIAETDGIEAIGLSVEMERTVTIYNMNTEPTARRRGHASRILETLLGTAVTGGCTEAMLQVTLDNTVAHDFYAAAGFVDRYRYHYREPPRA